MTTAIVEKHAPSAELIDRIVVLATKMVVKTKSGQTHSQTSPIGPGNRRNPLDEKAFDNKPAMSLDGFASDGRAKMIGYFSDAERHDDLEAMPSD